MLKELSPFLSKKGLNSLSRATVRFSSFSEQATAELYLLATINSDKLSAEGL
jgi:hypothetical protein